MRVGLDLDGVIYNFHASLRHYLHNNVGLKTPLPEPLVWNYHDSWGMSLQEWLDHFANGVDAGVVFSYGRPMAGAVEMVKNLQKSGHTIHVITDRSMGKPGNAASATVAWWNKYLPPFDSITFSRDKTVVKTDVMIDDKLENYDALVEAGCDAYLLNRSWNKHSAFGYDDGRQRVSSLAEFADAVCTRELVDA